MRYHPRRQQNELQIDADTNQGATDAVVIEGQQNDAAPQARHEDDAGENGRIRASLHFSAAECLTRACTNISGEPEEAGDDTAEEDERAEGSDLDGSVVDAEEGTHGSDADTIQGGRKHGGQAEEAQVALPGKQPINTGAKPLDGRNVEEHFEHQRKEEHTDDTKNCSHGRFRSC